MEGRQLNNESLIRTEINEFQILLFIHSYGPKFRTAWLSGLNLAFWDRSTETNLICSECDFTWQRNIVFKLFQEWTLLSDSEGGYELWSPGSQSRNLITIYFGKSTSGSAWSYLTLYKQCKKTLSEQLVAGEPLHSCRKGRNLNMNLSFLVGAFTMVLLATRQPNLSLFSSSTHPKGGQEDFLSIRSGFFN